MTVLLASYASILDPCYDGNMYTYATTKELKKRNYTINSQNITQENIHVTFMLEMKLQKYVFQQNMTMFVAANVPFLNQCDDVNVCTYAATKELKSKALTVNSQNIR